MNRADSTPPVPSDLQRARNELTAALQGVGNWVEQHGTLGLFALLAVYLLAEMGYSLATPLWHDELFTYFICQAHSLSEALSQTRVIDLNPPLSYVLTYASFHVFGVGTLQCRLPEVLGFAFAMTGLYLFVRRRAGSAYGLLAAALLFAGDAGDLSIQARPYGLMLGFSALALAAWQASIEAPTDRRYRLANVGLFFTLTCLLLSHVFGLMAWGALALGELFLTLDRRRMAAGRVAAMLLPLAAGYFYLPLVRNHGMSVFPASFVPTIDDLFGFYIGHIDTELITLSLTALVIVAIAGRSWLRGSERMLLTKPEWAVILCLIFAPAALILRLMLQHGAFFERYGVIACIGTSVFFVILLAWGTNSRASAAVIALVLALTISGRLLIATAVVFQQRAFHHTEPTPKPSNLSTTLDPALPLVDASGLTFIEMQTREPAPLLSRTYYLTGGAVAVEFAHATIFESMPWEVEHFHLPGHADTYEHFTKQHPRFYVLCTYDYPEDWLLRKLQADRAQLERIGNVDGSYKDSELYLVTVK